MTYDFRDKVVVVSGGTGALGRGVIDTFVAAGGRVISPDRAVPASGTGNAGCEYLLLDALDETSVREFFENTRERYGKVDVLVNVIGGYAAGDPVAALELKVFETQLDLNLKSAFLLTKYAVQTMSKQNDGKIVHVSSRAAIDKGQNSFAYSVSKLGVLRLVEAVALETRAQNITINAVMPSIIDTPANRKAMPNASFDKWPKPEQVARVIAFLASEEAGLISGAAIPVFGQA